LPPNTCMSPTIAEHCKATCVVVDTCRTAKFDRLPAHPNPVDTLASIIVLSEGNTSRQMMPDEMRQLPDELVQLAASNQYIFELRIYDPAGSSNELNTVTAGD
jgi:hypothetical protein